MKILLTGATGFVGRNFVVRARAKGWRVIAAVRDASKLAAQIEKEGLPADAVEIIGAEPEKWPNLRGIDGAVHCAGALFERTLHAYLRTNVDWALRVLGALPSGCPAVVLSSQSAGGPTPEGLDSRDEECPDEPISDYGESKLRMERGLAKVRDMRRTAILRPPMILGPRDSATLQLFALAKGRVRPKPGFKDKEFSFLAVEDLLSAIELAMAEPDLFGGRPHYVAAEKTVSDRELVGTAAKCVGGKGFDLPLPLGAVRILSAVVDAVPALRVKFPSMTRDRAKEIFPDRWVVNPGAFAKATGWRAKVGLEETLSAAWRMAEERKPDEKRARYHFKK